MVDYVSLPYVIGQSYGPMPPWLDGLRMLQPDETLLWKNRPGLQRKYIDVFSAVNSEIDRTTLLRRFRPVLPDSLKENPIWEISLNSHGFRDREFPGIKPANRFRIICFGDSWTFGANVGQTQAYPQRLEVLLEDKFPTAQFEVFNLGVLGYSSYQGLELLKTKIIELNPDLVIIAFAMNDSSIAGWRDKDMPAQNLKQNTVARRLSALLENIETYKLFRYWAQIIKFRPASLGDQLSQPNQSAQKPDDAVNYEKLEPWLRVSPVDYKKNLLEMIKLARAYKADVVLLYNQLSADAGEVAGIAQLGRTSQYRTVLEEISKTERIPLVDGSVLITEARRRIEDNLESKLNLRVVQDRGRRTQPNDEVEVVFRVYAGDRAVTRGMYITGTHAKLGGRVPNKVAMYDDGTHGDQKAGDKVWSYAATFPLETSLFYLYTNGGDEGKWQGLDVPHIRHFKVQSRNNGQTIYRPVESFGKIYMQADGWHTNAEGYHMIANAVYEVLMNNKKFAMHVSTATN